MWLSDETTEKKILKNPLCSRRKQAGIFTERSVCKQHQTSWEIRFLKCQNLNFSAQLLGRKPEKASKFKWERWDPGWLSALLTGFLSWVYDCAADTVETQNANSCVSITVSRKIKTIFLKFQQRTTVICRRFHGTVRSAKAAIHVKNCPTTKLRESRLLAVQNGCYIFLSDDF